MDMKKMIAKIMLVLSSIALLGGCKTIQESASTENIKEVSNQFPWGVSPTSGRFWHQRTPLHTSAAYGRVGIVKLLLEKGADVNICNDGGETPLHYATGCGQVEVMKVLLENGANVGKKGTVCGTPLQWAAENGRIREAKLLLDSGADIDQKGASGYTALSTAVAAQPEQIEMVKFLLSKGADVNSLDVYHNTPLNIAYSHNNAEIDRLLLQHGGDTEKEYEGKIIPDSFIKQIRKYRTIFRENIKRLKLMILAFLLVSLACIRLHDAADKGAF
jgi:ankyrin repeat protein